MDLGQNTIKPLKAISQPNLLVLIEGLCLLRFSLIGAFEPFFRTSILL